MAANAIVAGTFADMRSVKSRSVVVLHIEVPIERAADVVAMFGFPQPGAEIAVAVARLVASPVAPAAPPVPEPVAPAPAASVKERTPWDALKLAQQAGIACGEPEFRDWLASMIGQSVPDAESAAVIVRRRCGVNKSRAELDQDERCGHLWRALYGKYSRDRADMVGQQQAEAQAQAYRR